MSYADMFSLFSLCFCWGFGVYHIYKNSLGTALFCFLMGCANLPFLLD